MMLHMPRGARSERRHCRRLAVRLAALDEVLAYDGPDRAMYELAWIDAANALALAMGGAPWHALASLHAALAEPTRDEARVLVAAILAEDFVVPPAFGSWGDR